MLNSRPLLGLVLVVSCAHALVHLYELALPSVELLIAERYEVGPAVTGRLSNVWRFPYGVGALLAGWLVDRLGSRKMLALYLLGAGACCLGVALVDDLRALFPLMFLMGAACSIYHPAGLALLSHETDPATRTRALGLHGIFGSAGIAAAPFLAGLALSGGVSWWGYYGLLAIPGLALGGVFAAWSARRRRGEIARPSQPRGSDPADEAADWPSFFTLAGLAVLQGIIYAGVLSFLPRYIHQAEWSETPADEGFANYLTAGVLLLGCIGQYLAGRFGRADRLERQLTFVTLLNIPFLLWMALATGPERVAAAGLWAIVHFMHQPLYNSLIAKYSPRSRRSFCYGLSFAMGFGLGSFGASLAGAIDSPAHTYGVLAVLAAAAGGFGGALMLRNRAKPAARTGAEE